MTLLTFLVAVGAVALLIAGYFFSMRRLFELPLTGIELHPFYTADGWRIVLYRHRRGDSNGEPVLLVHGYSSNHWNLTAPRGVSVADYLADAGYDCWAIDLRGSRSSMPPPGTPRHRATFDGYVMHDLPGALDYIRSVTGHDQAHWVGHSLGGLLLYAYDLVHGGARIASGTTIASPTALHSVWPAWQSNLVRLLEFAPAAVAVVQRGMAPIHAFVRPRTRLVPIDWNNVNARFGVAEFFSAVETPPAPVTRTLEECAKHRYLAVDSDRVNVLAGLNRLDVPLLVFGCPLDPIVPVSALREFVDRLPSGDKRYVELSRESGCERDHDHIDPPFAKHGNTEVFAHIAEWLKAHPVRKVDLPEPVVVAARAAETRMVDSAVEVEPAAAGALQIRPDVRESPEPALDSRDAESPPLWGRALKNAANMLDGLGTESTEPAAVPGPVRGRTKRRGATVAAKRKTTKQRAATAVSAKRKSKARATDSIEKPEPDGASRIKTKAKSSTKSKQKAAAKSKSKSKSKKAAADQKKGKKKRDKSKDKAARKKSKDKKSSRK